jgi:hypothetical protein
MKTYQRVDIYNHVSLTSALVGGEWSASRSGSCTPGEKAPGTHWIEGWMGPGTGLDDVEKRNKIYQNLRKCSKVHIIGERVVSKESRRIVLPITFFFYVFPPKKGIFVLFIA